MPHVVPVCPILDGAKVYFASETTGKKIRNLRKKPSIAMVFDEYHDSWRGLKGVMIQGQAKIVDRKTFERVRTKLYKKYPPYKTAAALEYGESSIIEIAILQKVGWGM
jgi:nitroimidazol reductase NimA-like FMN-containing flavoprotein (pyridoxamine 5'-phosphate oxidase superfamily)